MGFVMDFDARNNILRVTLKGRVTDAILLESYATAARYAASHPPCRGIADFMTEFEVSGTAIKQLAGRSPKGANRDRANQSRRLWRSGKEPEACDVPLSGVEKRR